MKKFFNAVERISGPEARKAAEKHFAGNSGLFRQEKISFLRRIGLVDIMESEADPESDTDAGFIGTDNQAQ